MVFKKNDVVVVVSSIKNRGSNECKYTLCKIVAVGKFDLICEKTDTVYNRKFKVSKQRCLRVDLNLKYHESQPTNPKVGDLVYSFTDRYDLETTSITGIVEKISYNPIDQSEYVYHIRTGQKIERCYLKNLIILEAK